jgi:hypothetical protein
MDYSRFDNIGGTDSDSNSDCGCGLPKGRSEGDDADYDPYPEDPSYQRWLAFQNAKNGLVLRFDLNTRVECSVACGFTKGTIVRQWYRESDWAEHMRVPYQIQLDRPWCQSEGRGLVFCPKDEDGWVRALKGERSRSGEAAAATSEARLDTILMAFSDLAVSDDPTKDQWLMARRMTKLRFPINTRVECSTTNDRRRSWGKGTITRQWYAEPEWPDHEWAPYQVRLAIKLDTLRPTPYAHPTPYTLNPTP